MFKKITYGFLTTVLSIVIALLLAEGMIRMSNNSTHCKGYDPKPFVNSRIFSVINGYYEPGTKIHHCDKDFNYIYSIDDDGLRYSSENNSNILSIGDSFSFGFGVEDSKNYSYLIGSKNAGLWGNTYDVQLKSYLRNINIFNPKIVVWTVYPPHLITLTKSNWSSNCPGDSEISFKELWGITFIPRLLGHKIIKDSQLYSLILKSMSITEIRVDDSKFYIFRNCYETKEAILYDDNLSKTIYFPQKSSSVINSELNDAYDSLDKIFQKANEVADKKHIRLIIVLMPSKYYLNSRVSGVPSKSYANYIFNPELARNRFLTTLLSSGIHQDNILDIAEITEFSGNNWKKYYYNNDAHLNELGNQLVANYITKLIKSQIK